MLGLILVLSVLVIVMWTYGKKNNDSDSITWSFFCFIAIIGVISYWFSGATPRDYTSQKYQELDKKYHLEMQVALKNGKGKVLLKDANKVIYTDYVDRWHLFLGLVSFNEKKMPCVTIVQDKNNYSITRQDEILKVYYDNNVLHYLTFIIVGIMSWSVIEYTCAYDVSSDVLIN